MSTGALSLVIISIVQLKSLIQIVEILSTIYWSQLNYRFLILTATSTKTLPNDVRVLLHFIIDENRILTYNLLLCECDHNESSTCSLTYRQKSASFRLLLWNAKIVLLRKPRPRAHFTQETDYSSARCVKEINWHAVIGGLIKDR